MYRSFRSFPPPRNYSLWQRILFHKAYLPGGALFYQSMVTMVVAAVTVHMQHSWLAIAEATGPFATPRTEGAIERLEVGKQLLQEHGNYDWLTENGSFVILNNGIEFAVTYFIVLLALFFIGSGRYSSMDYWIRRGFIRDY